MTWDSNCADRMMGLHSLASSAQQIREETLKDDRLFAKSRERHSIEVTKMGPDTTHHPETFILHDSSQLSVHLTVDIDNASTSDSCLEI
jgi:hypothetical protein